MMKNNGLIFIIRARFFISKLNYYQIETLLDLVRKRKKELDSKNDMPHKVKMSHKK